MMSSFADAIAPTMLTVVPTSRYVKRIQKASGNGRSRDKGLFQQIGHKPTFAKALQRKLLRL